VSDKFDPYYKWLGIRPAEQPPTLYRLLNISQFESDAEVIEAAAEQRLLLLRSQQSGRHAAESQKLLNEVMSARNLLLDPAKKPAYDAQLQAQNQPPPAQQAVQQPAQQQPAPAAFNAAKTWQAAPRNFSVAATPRRQRIAMPVILAVVAVAAIAMIALAGGVAWFASSTVAAVPPVAPSPVTPPRVAPVKPKPPAVVPPVVPPVVPAVTPAVTPAPRNNGDDGNLLPGAPGGAPPLAQVPFSPAQAKQHQKAWADYLGVPVTREFSLGQNSDGSDAKLKMVLTPPGEFLMGMSNDERADRTSGMSRAERDEFNRQHPQHRVRLTQPYWISQTEVTRKQFRRFKESTGYRMLAEREGSGRARVRGKFTTDKKYNWLNPGITQTGDHPVVVVSRTDAIAFCQWLSRKHGIVFHLPGEAQWEYACRAGTDTRWNFGSDINAAKGHIWFNRTSGFQTHPAGQLPPNAFGLYDMHGNVWEWCADWLGGKYDGNSVTVNPGGGVTGKLTPLCGGAWNDNPYSSSHRHYQPLPYCQSNIGIRLAAVVSVPPYDSPPVAAYSVDVSAAQAASEADPTNTVAAQRLIAALMVQPQVLAGYSPQQADAARAEYLSALSQHMSSQIVEPGWRISQVINFPGALNARLNPRDGNLYGIRSSSGVCGLYRVDPSGGSTKIVDLEGRNNHLVIDPKSGGMFVSEERGGGIFRIQPGSNSRSKWISGLHRGDDDPAGMAIAPAIYTGRVVPAGGAIVVDCGNNGLDEIWRFSVRTPENESVVHADNGT